MNKFLLGLATSVIIVGLYYSFYIREPEKTSPVAIELPSQIQINQNEEEAPPPILYPVPEIVAEYKPVSPLPILDESDPSIEEEFNGMVDNPDHSDLLLFKTFIRNFVVIVDNVTAKILPQKYYFLRPPTGTFKTTITQDEIIYLDPENYQRYVPFINMVNSLDLQRLVQIYTYLYPLFQEAYIELGYPDRYFNDRLIEVIDTLLQTPDITGPVKLIQPTVYYKFAQSELEALDAGQKLLIRIGVDNSNIIKARLRDVKQRLTGLNGTR